MRTAITLHRRHGEDNFTVAAGPEISVDEQKQAAKKIASGGRIHPDLAEVQVWTSSGGLDKRFRFDAPASPQSGKEKDPKQKPKVDSSKNPADGKTPAAGKQAKPARGAKPTREPKS